MDCDPLDVLADGELIARWRTGEPDAFAALFRRYDRPLRGFIYKLTHDSERTRDFAQETWLRVAEWMQIASHGNFFSAICTIAKCRVIDALERRATRERLLPELAYVGIQGASGECVYCKRPAKTHGMCDTHAWRKRMGWTEEEMRRAVNGHKRRNGK